MHPDNERASGDGGVVTPQDLEGRWGGILDQLREGFQVIGPDWRYLYVNQAVGRHGRRRTSELLGRTMMELYPGIETTPMYALLERCMRERSAGEMENEFTYPDGERAWFELRVRPIREGLLVLSIDITARKQLERQLRQSQKLEAVGQLAGGIAHDFNNLLTVISSFSTLAMDSVAADSPARADMAEVLSAAERAARLVRQLLEFSSKRPIDPQVLSINELVSALETLLQRTLGDEIELATALEPALGLVRIDPGAFEQILVNLAVNARDAMYGGGTLTIETGNAVLDDSYRMTRGGDVRPGDYVMLSVSDSGCGIEPAVVEQIFEPFFSTKEAGRGTGLGLATTYGIVRQAGGYIWVYSELNNGTTFKIYLPRATEGTARARPRPSRSTSPPGTERVLVVEDDPQVRKLAVRALRRCGYHVLEAASCSAALRLFESDPQPIDLLLTDVVMPRMGGKELAARLTQQRPQLRVLYMSGYTENAIAHQGMLDHGVSLLEKPFTPDALARKVREALDG